MMGDSISPVPSRSADPAHPVPWVRWTRLGGRVLPGALLTTALCLFSGCSTSKKKGSGMDGYNQLIRSQQQGLALHQLQHPTVFVHGAVKQPMVPWRPDMTLAEALLEAGYNTPFTPSAIRVVRQGTVHPIDIRRLLRGTINPVLEPGDVVEVYK